MPIFQVLSIIASVAIILLLIELVKTRRLEEKYSLLWFGISFVFLLFSLWRQLLDYLASLIGVDYPPAAIFLIMIISAYLLLLHFSVVISRLTKKNKDLSQEIGLLDLKIKELAKNGKTAEKDED